MMPAKKKNQVFVEKKEFVKFGVYSIPKNISLLDLVFFSLTICG